MTTALHILEIPGTELAPWLDVLGELRIRVFHEYPYLYDGTLEYERDYLRVYQDCAESRIVLVADGRGELIGATTCLPLAAEAVEFQKPFLDAGLPVREYLYFGESVVLPEWRGKGLGKEFFTRREAHAVRLGLKRLAFCAVDRPGDHPQRPAGYTPLDGFWESRGFERQPELRAEFAWKETGEAEESLKTLTFWTKTCAG
jgi:GNAT superfamily N-acetyltransferase